MSQLLEPIPGENPCGIDLSKKDLEYYDLGRLITVRQEGMIVDKEGRQVSKQEDVDWRVVLQKCNSLLEKSKDLQLLVYRALALLEVRGLPGLAEGLESLVAIVQNFWAQLYPPLDEDGDPTERVNILVSIAQPMGSFGDPLRFIERLRSAPLLKVPIMGPVSFEFLSGVSSVGGEEVSNMRQLPEFLKHCDPAELEDNRLALKRSLAAVKMLDSFLEEKIGLTRSPSWEVLESTLRAQGRIYEGNDVESKSSPEAKTKEGPDGARAEGGGGPEERAGTEGYARRLETPAAGGVSNGAMTIANADDVVNCLDLICKYYAQAEPSSPVPILLQRARGLVRKSFFQVIDDLAPEAAAQLRSLAGIKNDLP